jgi:NTP pyrophosphatase (non-canonical NTP hydrolase)
MLLIELKDANKRRCLNSFGHSVDGWNLPEWGNALAGETGELCNILKKIHRGDYSLKHANDNNLIANEAADIVIYLDLLCQRAGVNLEQAIIDKFNETSSKVGSIEKLY